MNKWTNEDICKLYNLKFQELKTPKEISKELNKSLSSVKKKITRTDWNNFSKTNTPSSSISKKWSHEEMIRLHSYLQSGKSYAFISEQLDRSIASVESKSQHTDWEAWKSVSSQIQTKIKSEQDIQTQSKLVDALITLSRHDLSRLKDITKEEMLRKINAENLEMPCSFEELKRETVAQLEKLGLGNPEAVSLKSGTYIIVGDSHGKHTKTKMFDMLKNFNKFLSPDKIIHIGHLLDDDNDISYNWGIFDNLIVLPKSEELKLIQGQRNKFNFHFDIVRGGITLGNSLLVANQDMINDYVTTSIRNLDSEIFEPQVVVNCHRLETASKCSDDNTPQYLASPGALCEKHVIKTIKQIDFTDDKTVKMSFHSGFSKYRKFEHMNGYWNQALIVVHVDKNGDHTIVPCPIHKIENEYATSYFNKIISSDGVFDPDSKIFVVADIHSPNHDSSVLDIQEQICKDYGADKLVNVGDAHDFRALNHHDIDKGNAITGDALEESAQTHHILKRMTSWAKEYYIIKGNHERFGNDFSKKFPQLATCLDFAFMCDLKGLGYKITDMKDVLRIGGAKFIHGELSFFGQNGTMLEKASRVFGHNTFAGHIHYPSIRFGALSVGLTGKMNQGYNEPKASSWIHGFGLCNQYKGVTWSTTIGIVKNLCHINDKTYKPKNQSAWDVKNYSVKLTYCTK